MGGDFLRPVKLSGLRAFGWVVLGRASSVVELGRARLRLKGISSEQILRGFACGRVFSKEGTVKSGRTRQKQASFEVWNLKSLTTRW